MKALSDYEWRDWRRLRPITHWLKTSRYDAQREHYVRLPARSEISVADRIRDQRVLVTIAFEDPEAIDIQAQLVTRFVPNAIYVVADMSMDDQAAARVAAAAADH